MKAMRASGRNADGFSLLEAVVSLAILSLALGAMMQALSASSLLADTSKMKYDATMRAQMLIDLVGSEFPLEQATYDGSSERFTWHLSVQEYSGATEQETTASEPKLVELYEIRSEVSWSRGNESRSVTLSTVRTPRDTGFFGGMR